MRPGISLCLCLLWTCSAQAAVLRVPKDHATITLAEAAAKSGDTIKISKGRYTESVITTKSLTFVGAGGAIWDGYFGAAHNDQLVATAANVKVTGITFQNGDVPITINGDNAIVTDCVFEGTDDGVVIDGAGASVAKNTFFGIQDYLFAVSVAGPGAVVDKNTIANGQGCAIRIDAESAGAATVTDNDLVSNGGAAVIDIQNASGASVTKNKIANCHGSHDVCISVEGDDSVVKGNVLSNVNGYLEKGIYVSGERACITKNSLKYLIGWSNDIACIWVDGGNAKIEKNKIACCGAGEEYDTWGIYVDGTSATVSKNTIEDLAGGGDYTYGILIAQANAMVSNNKISGLNDEYSVAISCSGANATVDGNHISDIMDDSCLEVTGDDFRISDNVIKSGCSGAIGIYAAGNATTAKAAVIEKNHVSSLAADGIVLEGNGVIVRDNTVKQVAGIGIDVTGDNNVLVKNTVANTQDDAFNVSGSGNELTKCTAKKACRDGFDIGGSAAVLTKCEAWGCAAEGLDNLHGTGTSAMYCVLRESRYDYAGNGTMAVDTGTKYSSGGPGTVPEID